MCHIALVVAGIVIPQLKLSSCICLPSGSLAIKRLMMAPSGAGVFFGELETSPIYQSWHYSESQIHIHTYIYIYIRYCIISFYRFFITGHADIYRNPEMLIGPSRKRMLGLQWLVFNISQSLGFTSPFSNFIVLRHAWCQAKGCDCCPCCLPPLLI